jgi:hypothetical protein
MRDLQQHCRSAHQEWDERPVAESPDHAFRREVAIPALQALRVRRRARISCVDPPLCHADRMPTPRTGPPARPSALMLRLERNRDEILVATADPRPRRNRAPRRTQDGRQGRRPAALPSLSGTRHSIWARPRLSDATTLGISEFRRREGVDAGAEYPKPFVIDYARAYRFTNAGIPDLARRLRRRLRARRGPPSLPTLRAARPSLLPQSSSRLTASAASEAAATNASRSVAVEIRLNSALRSRTSM